MHIAQGVLCALPKASIFRPDRKKDRQKDRQRVIQIPPFLNFIETGDKNGTIPLEYWLAV